MARPRPTCPYRLIEPSELWEMLPAQDAAVTVVDPVTPYAIALAPTQIEKLSFAEIGRVLII